MYREVAYYRLSLGEHSIDISMENAIDIPTDTSVGGSPIVFEQM